MSGPSDLASGRGQPPSGRVAPGPPPGTKGSGQRPRVLALSRVLPRAPPCLSVPLQCRGVLGSPGHSPVRPALLPSGRSWLGSCERAPPPPAPQQCRLGRPGQLGLVPGAPAVRKPRVSHPNMSWCCHPPGITGSAELRAAVSGWSRGGNGAGGTLGAPSWGQQGLAPV